MVRYIFVLLFKNFWLYFILKCGFETEKLKAEEPVRKLSWETREE